MKVKILGSAFEDLDRARLFYETQEPGLGTYFLDSIFSDIDSLLLYAGVHRKVFGSHRLLAKRFPYAIYYKLQPGSTAVVWRVLDLRQSPGKHAKALK